MARRALTIGINTYQHLSQLFFAENDALAVATALEQPEAKFDSVSTLIAGCSATSGSQQTVQVTAAAVRAAIERLSHDAKPGDQLLLYFSGHGCLHHASDGVRVVLGVHETSLNDLSNTVIDVAKIVETLGCSSAAHITLVIDACREKKAGSATSSKSFGQEIKSTIESSVKAAASQMPTNGKSWEILTACSDGQVAKECGPSADSPSGGGIWTRGLLRSVDRYIDALRKSSAAAPLTISQLFHHVADGQKSDLADESRPWYHRTRDSLILLTKVRDQCPEKIAILTSDVVRTYATPLRLLTDDRVTLQRCDKSTAFQQETIHLVPFSSDYREKYLEEFEDLGVDRCNESFSLRLYLPNLGQFTPPFNNLFILINGLAESNSKILDEVGLQLARRGIPAILLPLPRHFTRFVIHESHDDPYRPSPQFEKLYSQQILQTIYKNPAHLVYMFDQISADVDKLVGVIDRTREPGFLNGLFDPAARVSLFGYSVGGLCSLGIMFSEFQKRTRSVDIKTLSAQEIQEKFRTASANMRFSCAVLLESGLPLDEIDTSKLYRRTLEQKPMQVSASSEKEPSICEILSDAYLHGPNSARNRSFIDKKFERLFSDREVDKATQFEQLIRSPTSSPLPKLFERSQVEADCIWRDIIMDLHTLVERGIPNIAPARIDLFRRVFLGDHPTRNKFELDALNRKILCVAGGEDEIFPAIKLLASPMGGLATLQVPGMSHWLKVSGAKHWAYWHRLIIDLAVGFEQAYHDSPRE